MIMTGAWRGSLRTRRAGRLAHVSHPAVLREPELALVPWPDGAVGVAWEMPAGELVEVDEVVPTSAGFMAWVHPVSAPELFALVEVALLVPADEPVPF